MSGHARPFMHTMLRLLALLAAVMAFTPAARAVESAAVRSPRATVTLIADQAAIAPGQAFLRRVAPLMPRRRAGIPDAGSIRAMPGSRRR